MRCHSGPLINHASDSITERSIGSKCSIRHCLDTKNIFLQLSGSSSRPLIGSSIKADSAKSNSSSHYLSIPLYLPTCKIELSLLSWVRRDLGYMIVLLEYHGAQYSDRSSIKLSHTTYSSRLTSPSLFTLTSIVICVRRSCHLLWTQR